MKDITSISEILEQEKCWHESMSIPIIGDQTMLAPISDISISSTLSQIPAPCQDTTQYDHERQPSRCFYDAPLKATDVGAGRCSTLADFGSVLTLHS